MLRIVFCILLFLAGCTLCFFGARLYRFWFGLVGLLTGVLAGYQIGPAFFGSQSAGLIAALVLGILFAAFFAILAPVGVTLSSAFLFGLIVVFLLEGFGLSSLWWVILMAAVAGAVLGAIFSKTLVVFGSALQGGYLMVLSGLVLYASILGLPNLRFDPMVSLLILTIALGLGLMGVVIQNRGLRISGRRTIEPVLRRDGQRPPPYRRGPQSYNRYT